MTATRVTLLVHGAIAGLIGMALVAAGLALLVFDAAGQDEDGYFISPSYELSTDGYAITSRTSTCASRPSRPPGRRTSVTSAPA